MNVKEFIPLSHKNYDVMGIMSEICNTFADENETMIALSKYYGRNNKYKVTYSMPFSSDRKYSKITFESIKLWMYKLAQILTVPPPREFIIL